MVRNKFSIVVYAIIGLAIIGVVSQLFINPANFFRNILIMLGMSVVIFAVFYFFLRKRTNIKDDEMKKYKQAVKQSQRKYKGYNINPILNNKDRKKTSQLKRKNRRRPSHLRVIDGTGGKQNEKNELHFK